MPKVDEISFKFHHMGVACRNLNIDTKYYRLFGYKQEGGDFIDINQGIKGRFLVGEGPRLELVMPYEDSTVLSDWLERNVKYYHRAYKVRDIYQASKYLQSERGIVVSPPKSAVAFDGRQVTFIMMPTMSLVELIEEC